MNRVKKKRKKPAVLFIRNIPNRLKERFKAHCYDRGVSMTEGIIELMEQTIDKEPKNYRMRW